MELTQAVCVVNWNTEQLEVSGWFKSTDEKKIYKQMDEITKKIFHKFVKPLILTGKDVNDVIRCYGNGIEEFSSKSEIEKLKNQIHFVYAHGYYLDEKVRSYFVPTETIVEKTVNLNDLENDTTRLDL